MNPITEIVYVVPDSSAGRQLSWQSGRLGFEFWQASGAGVSVSQALATPEMLRPLISLISSPREHRSGDIALAKSVLTNHISGSQRKTRREFINESAAGEFWRDT
ncbi:hypothetical protein RRG08_043032 [Elysia crispata]|uniref:Uncharacterized protein n=1 Tax=Elysia crispata TaxID=231223 RepID=A0AAE0XZG7_9GAST|nr:hypothetical protein RRG08_043032 [Elysia crispata]